MNMDFLVEIIEWVGYIFAIIGATATVYKAFQVWINFQKITWKEVDRYTKKIISQIATDRFTPDIIVTIGRGGAIIGSLISGNLQKVNSLNCNIPILGTDRLYEWRNGQRNEIENEMIDFAPLKNKSVLLVAGDVITGGTMKHYINKIISIGANKIRSACLVKSATSVVNPNYVGKIITAKFKLPWMYKGYDYIRDSRHPY